MQNTTTVISHVTAATPPPDPPPPAIHHFGLFFLCSGYYNKFKRKHASWAFVWQNKWNTSPQQQTGKQSSTLFHRNSRKTDIFTGGGSGGAGWGESGQIWKVGVHVRHQKYSTFVLWNWRGDAQTVSDFFTATFPLSFCMFESLAAVWPSPCLSRWRLSVYAAGFVTVTSQVRQHSYDSWMFQCLCWLHGGQWHPPARLCLCELLFISDRNRHRKHKCQMKVIFFTELLLTAVVWWIIWVMFCTCTLGKLSGSERYRRSRELIVWVDSEFHWCWSAARNFAKFTSVQPYKAPPPHLLRFFLSFKHTHSLFFCQERWP